VSRCSPSISQDEQFAGSRVSLAALLKPPLSDSIDGKGWSVVAGSQKDGAPVGLCVINTIGGGESVGLGAEIVIVHRNGIAVPLGSGVFEVANQLLLLRIHADDGLALGSKLFPLPVDMRNC
jgi:hypothetical protein